ncbi:restriction endonuclease [Amniculibacterium sp. G2-70]|uniref:restriction endonuclease n=1 Tax=Amniculibacterium sp. G2-70 TaxID=2767188 RepID=UPI00165485D6|nr:restriction endonuclease [Amniculibacterium sp. G2-70]
MSTIDAKYFKEYREKLGFTNQGGVKAFFGAKDISPTVDYNYIQLLNSRLSEIIKKINDLVIEELKLDEIDDFTLNNIDLVFQKLKNNNIITRLNNQGRRPEEVYFSWMRGFVISTYFFKAISKIFDIDISKIKTIGDDDLESIETFKRTPKADLEICLKTKEVIRIEVQSGFQGINDIKQHKVQEAKRSKFENNISTFVIHFDLFNGQVAFVKIDEIEDNNVNWITRQQMEGQTVFNIDQNYFIWKLTEKPPMLTELSFY